MIRTLDQMGVMADGLLRWGCGAAEPEALAEADLARLLREVAADGDPGAPMAYEGPDHLVLRARPVALRRAFANLASNARRHAGGGVIRLSVADDLATVAVEDDGPRRRPRRPGDPAGAVPPRRGLARGRDRRRGPRPRHRPRRDPRPRRHARP